MKLTLLLFIAIVLVLFLAVICRADTFTDEQAIRAIIGEASNQGFFGMKCVACAIINRGTLKGVYGLHSKHIDKEPQWVWKMARKAYYDAKTGIPIHTGTHWENIKAFGTPYWVKNVKLVYEHKDHRFYKEVCL